MALQWRAHPVLQPPTPEELAKMDPEKVLELWEMYHAAIENAERDPYRYGFVLPHWKHADEQLEKFNELLISGGNRCLAGEQEVYDPVKKKTLRVDQITEGFHVEAWDEATQSFVHARALPPFQKPAQALYRISLANGRTLSCSGAHLVLTPVGWREVSSLTAGMSICGTPYTPSECPPPESGPCPSGSTSGTVREASRQDVLRWNRTAQGSLSDCQSYRYSCGEQPLSGEDYARGIAPSQGGAPECTSPFDSTYLRPSGDELRSLSGIQGGRAPKRGYSHSYPPRVLPSILGALLRRGDRSVGTLYRAFCKPYLSACKSHAGQVFRQEGQQSSAGSSLAQSTHEFALRGNQSQLFSYGDDSIAHVEVLSIDFLRHDAVWDFEVPEYHNYVAGGVISHNSAKTTYAARAVVRAAIENPGSVIMCFSQNADVSIRQQQCAIYDALPEELRKKTLGAEENVSYTRKNGFSKASLILPGSRSQIIFKTYAQFLNNDTILEGAELGSKEAKWINIGAWCDEYLIGPELLTTLRFRLATRNAKMIVTFTPIDGYTEVVRDYREGAKTIASKPADLLNGRLVPTIQHSKNRNAAILYFHTKDNPFGGYERIADDLKGRPEEEILTRAYGIPTKSYSCQFPNFSQEVNVIPHDKIPKTGVTRYMALDPAGAKNWFMAWIAVDATGTYYVYREWPDVEVGDWAKWHGGKWILGQGAKGIGYGIKDYVDLIKRYEGDEGVFERIIDPRMGAAKYQAQDGASSIIEDLADNGMIFVPAPGLEIDDGIQALQSKMAYDRTKPLDGINRPRFYVSDRCENVIWALQEYTGEDRTEPAKDVIDVLRYLAITGCDYIDPKAFKAAAPKRGGY